MEKGRNPQSVVVGGNEDKLGALVRWKWGGGGLHKGNCKRD